MQTQNQSIVFFAVASTLIVLSLLGFIILMIYLLQKKNLLFSKEVEHVKAAHEKELLQTQLEIQEQTFQHISREIHDNIGLSLTLAKLQLNTVDQYNPQKTADDIDSSVELISKAIIDLSDLSKSLNSEVIKNHGLYNTLKTETEKINRSGKYHIEFTEEGNSVFLSAQKELILYRIAQEALNNVLKHASASLIRIRLSYTSHHICMSIEDNGQGFAHAPAGNWRSGKINNGITNMRTRALMLNGTFDISSREGTGTVIRVTAPY